MKAVICPVCDGRGEIKEATIEGVVTTKITTRLCHGCGGKGWVAVANDREFVVNTSWSQDSDRCPSCGNDRYSPASTGCPMGSHYG